MGQRYTMKWITREFVKVERVACPWLIKKFVDNDAEFIFAPRDKVLSEAKSQDAIPFDVRGAELDHKDKKCTFEAIIEKYELTENLALGLLAKIVNGADTDNSLHNQPEGPGLYAIAHGFRDLDFEDDHEIVKAESIVYDALYNYCEDMVRSGKANGKFKP